MSNLLIREGRAARILLVEDHRGDVQMARQAFKTAKIDNSVEVAETGEAALERLADTDLPLPDIVLLDLNLPRMQGRDVLKAIKSNERLKHIPVIILSGSGGGEDVTKLYDLHASAYIVKPVNLDNFKTVVATIEQFFFFLAVLPDAHSAA